MTKVYIVEEGLGPRVLKTLLEKGFEVSLLNEQNKRSLKMQLAIQSTLIHTSEAELNYEPDRGNRPAYRNTLPRRQSRY